MEQTKTLHGGVRNTDCAGPEQRWVEIFADHVRRRFNSRALVRVRIGAAEAMELAYIYAIEGGLVLTLPSEEPEHHGDGHEHHGVHRTGGHAEGGGRLLNGELGTGVSEIWIASPGQAIFEVRRAQDGVLCTGFGYLGLSRTPRLMIPRGTEPPPPQDPHKHDDF